MSTATAEPTAAPQATEPTSTNAGPPQTDEARAKARANQPTYGLQKLGGGLPEQEDTGSSSRGRSDLYLNLLLPLTQDPGEWYEVAYFKTANGAAQALKAIQEGTKVKDENGNEKVIRRAIPAGDWEMETRRFQATNPDGSPVIENGKAVRHSKLFARYMGNATE